MSQSEFCVRLDVGCIFQGKKALALTVTATNCICTVTALSVYFKLSKENYFAACWWSCIKVHKNENQLQAANHFIELDFDDNTSKNWNGDHRRLEK